MVRVYGEHVHHEAVDFTEWQGYIVSTSEEHCVAYNLFFEQ